MNVAICCGLHSASDRRVDPSLFKSIIAGYLASSDFTGLRDRTKEDYLKQIAKIERAFGDLPIAALDDPKITGVFLRWRDGMASSPKQADYAWTVLMLLISWARRDGLTTYRPPGRIDRLYSADRSDKIWEEHHCAAFMAVAPPPLQCALVVAIETGLRQGDVLRLTWGAYDGQWIRLTPSKSVTRKKPKGRGVAIPVSRRLRAVIESLPRVSPVMLTNSRGRPWRPNAFRKAWEACTAKACIAGLTFHDLRGTASGAWRSR